MDSIAKIGWIPAGPNQHRSASWITNHPEIVRRLGIVSMNTTIEIDLGGNVNSTHPSAIGKELKSLVAAGS
jgi:hypothetical protein